MLDVRALMLVHGQLSMVDSLKNYFVRRESRLSSGRYVKVVQHVVRRVDRRVVALVRLCQVGRARHRVGHLVGHPLDMLDLRNPVGHF